MGMQTWRQERQKTNKFTMGTSRQMTTLPHKTNPEAHTMLEGQIVSVPPVHLHEYQFQKCCERRNGECVAGRDMKGNALIGLSKLFG